MSFCFVNTNIPSLDIRDDEYRKAGIEDPKLMITTSRNPSTRLKQFVKVTSAISAVVSVNI